MSKLVTQYEFYGADGIKSGLEANAEGFTLNGKSIRLVAGSAHYFRIHPEYWRDRLRKLRACGLIAVTTYVPWNLHEPKEGEYDFGDGKHEMSPFLDIIRYIKTAQEEDLFVILRPGPYICSEWDFGGLPSWLLRVPNIRLRTSNAEYISKVQRYFDKLLPLLKDHQFTNGGSIIGVQIENEYGADGIVHDKKYLHVLKDMLTEQGIREFFFTSDNYLNSKMEPLPIHTEGSIPGALMTVNFQKSPEHWLTELKKIQPDLPVMVMEYWTGWLDHWLEPTQSNANPPTVFRESVETILKFPGHINFYMFHGGTNFGFTNGANQNTLSDYAPDVTSYDYYAPLRENGDYTEKYKICRELLQKYNETKTRLPLAPEEIPAIALPNAEVTEFIPYEKIIEQVSDKQRIQSEHTLSMEELDINDSNGQSFGYLLYRKENIHLQQNSQLQLTGYVRDVAIVLVDNHLVSKPLSCVADLNQFGYWKKKDGVLKLKQSAPGPHTLDILVENMGRVNYGPHINQQKKGIYQGPVKIDDMPIKDWTHIPLEFKSDWVTSLSNWQSIKQSDVPVNPGLYKAKFHVDSTKQDTFVDMSDWVKGVVFINGFNLGRYWNLGPQRTMYLPGPLLKPGENEVIVFEMFTPGLLIRFLDHPILG